jgi:hypothetical protein
MEIVVDRYKVKTVTRPNKPGQWNSLICEIYEDDKKIGEYLRNYSSLYNTFFPFKRNEQWYALYSKDYTATRVMTLPDCKDYCGEEADSFGFCPVNYYVPRYKRISYEMKFDYKAGKKVDPYYDVLVDYYWDEKEFQESIDYHKNNPEKNLKFDSEWIYCPFGFVAGCVWGDDSSWKIQFIDLSKLNEKKITNTAKFGYIELPYNMDLKDSIDMRLWEEDCNRIQIIHQDWYDLDKEVKENES